jgi:hypothetical protein
MKHAGEVTLAQLEPLLNQVRQFQGLIEKKRGTFYKKSAAFLHFHEDVTGNFADLKIGKEWIRLAVNNQTDYQLLLGKISELV